MKSKAVKRREARERIEKSLPALEAETKLVRAAINANPQKEQLAELTSHYAKLLEKHAYRLKEIEHIKAKESGRGARKEPHPEIMR